MESIGLFCTMEGGTEHHHLLPLCPPLVGVLCLVSIAHGHITHHQVSGVKEKTDLRRQQQEEGEEKSKKKLTNFISCSFSLSPIIIRLDYTTTDLYTNRR